MKQQFHYFYNQVTANTSENASVWYLLWWTKMSKKCWQLLRMTKMHTVPIFIAKVNNKGTKLRQESSFKITVNTIFGSDALKNANAYRDWTCTCHQSV